MEKGDDPYEILGVPNDASDSEIKKAYRKAALKYHPDKQQTEEDKERAHDIFAKLSAAYDTLSDPVKRYDWRMAHEKYLEKQKAAAAAPQKPRKSAPPGAAGAAAPTGFKRHSTPAGAGAPPPGSGAGGGRGSGGGGTSPRPKQRASTPNTSSSVPNPNASRTPQPPPKKKAPGSSGSGGGGTSPHPPKRTSAPAGSAAAAAAASGGPRGPGRAATKRTSAPVVPSSSSSTAVEKHVPRTKTPPPPKKHAPKNDYRDPFDIFETVMKEEYGDDYKNTDTWKESKGVIGLAKMVNPFKSSKRIKESSKKEFKKLDVNKDKALTKDELRKYIESHQDLWTTLGMRLNLPVNQCMEIATNVAFQLATGRGERKPLSNEYYEEGELSEEEFTHFHKNYVLDDKGAYEFFLRTIFTAFDRNGDGVFQRNELANFLDVFYASANSSNVFKGKDMQLPPKPQLHKIVMARLDKNRDGVLTFYEMRDLLEVAAIVTSEKPE